MKRLVILPLVLSAVLAQSGCATMQAALGVGAAAPGADAAAAATSDGPMRPNARPAGLDTTPPPPPPPTARTVEDFDTTTAEDRAEALVVPAAVVESGERRLGTTIASLGSPTDPGIWLKTPLVTEVTQGRVEFPDTGKTVNVELRPSGGAPGSGSQISLAAMRLLEAPLTGLPELVVYAY